MVFDSGLKHAGESLYDLHELSCDIVVTLPHNDEALTALRHIHTIRMQGHEVTLAIPARIFESSHFLSYTKFHSHFRVDEACNLLQYHTGEWVPGRQKYHVCTLVTNQQASVMATPSSAVSSSRPIPFVDLYCTMPVRIQGHHAKALIDTASNHSMISLPFLNRHRISFTSEPSASAGISAVEAPCLGFVFLDTRVGRHNIQVRFTVVESLPSAAADTHQPNEVLLALDVITAVDMDIKVRRPRIIISIPDPKKQGRRKHKDWLHVVHLEHMNYTTESSPLDDFLVSKGELNSLVNKAIKGTKPLYVVAVRAVSPSHIACSGTRKQGYLAGQVPPGHVPQDITEVPESIKIIIDKHKLSGGTLGEPPPNVSASGFEMDIDLLPGTRPKAARQYRLTPREQTELEKQLQHLINMGWVQPSVSPWASAVLFAPKPGGKLRLCIDYRYLNEHTIKNTYPLPRIDTLLDKLKGHKFFSALDLASGYHQIKLSDSAGPKTAFRTPDGLYQWKVMPFGLSNAPSVFQQAMHVVLNDLLGSVCLAYLDDIIILGRDEQEHAANLDQVLTRLSEHNFFCNLAKCQFALTEIKYLGHLVTADTVKPDPYKVKVLQDWPESDLAQSNNQIRSFLGLAGYFRRFIPKFPTLAEPLLSRIKTKEVEPWTTQCSQAFAAIKHALVHVTVMRHPDLNRPFHIYTDASDFAFGAVLTQEHEGVQYPVAWAGRKMSRAEVNYYTLEKELAAIVFAHRQWRCYLENNHPVFIHSDHNPLRFLQTQKKLTGKHARWLESLSAIDWRITYIPGDENVVADAVSRALHLSTSDLILHDGNPLASESPRTSIPALSLTNYLVRRPSPHAEEYPNPLSKGKLFGSGGQIATFREILNTSPPRASLSSQQISPQEMAVISLLRRLRGNAGTPNTAPVPEGTAELMSLLLPSSNNNLTRRCPTPPQNPRALSAPLGISPAAAQPPQPSLSAAAALRPTPLPRPTPAQARQPSPSAPPGLPPPATVSAPPPSPPAQESEVILVEPAVQPPQPPLTVSSGSEAATAGQQEKPVTPTASSDGGMVIDQQTLADIGMSLHEQHTSNLNLDIRVDDFWSRLRQGYAHDPAFKTPDPRYSFDNHLMCYFLGHKLVIPDYDSLRKQILLWHHVHPWHAHMGISRTQHLIMDAFFWPGISKDISDFISQCHSCQVMKSIGKQDSVLSPLPIPTASWRVISLDMITQLPRTRSDFDCIVVFVDQFSKMVRLIPAKSTLDGPGFSKLFFQHVYPHYGLPLGICSDRGVQWNNKFFRDICDHMGIKLSLTYSYHPRANGQVERLNRVIEEALRHFVSPAHDDWDTFLPHIEFSINSSRNNATGCTPFQLNRITPPLSPTAIAFKLPESRQLNAAVLHRMYYHLAKQSLSEAKQSMWAGYVKPSVLARYQVGKPVLLSTAKLSTYHPSLRRKFTARWLGPCKIIELVGSRAARIELPATLQSNQLHDVFHFSCLKPYIDSHLHESTPIAGSPPANEDESFEVESILDYVKSYTRRTKSGKLTRHGPRYKVRWKGYSSEHDLWLPVSELSNCLDKVADYLFQTASSRQRTAMINQFPKRDRAQLTHILQRAQPAATAAGHRDMSKPPSTRRRGRDVRLPPPPGPPLKAAIARHCTCSCCGVRIR